MGSVGKADIRGTDQFVSAHESGFAKTFEVAKIVGDDRGSPAIIDMSGKKQTIPVACESTQGIVAPSLPWSSRAGSVNS